jgi:hypothetical protein
MHIYVSSGDSELLYPENRWNDFTVELPNPIHLTEAGGPWEMCVTQYLVYAKKPNSNNRDMVNPLYILCDSVECSVVGSKECKVLAVVQPKEDLRKLRTPTNPQYVRILGGRLSQIHLYLRDGEGDTLSFVDGSTWCALHIRKAPRC